VKLRITGIVFALALLSFQVCGAGAGEAPDADSIMKEMKDALEPEIASTRTLKFTIMDEKGAVTNTWIAREGRMELSNGKRTLLVMLQPEEVKGVARLVWEKEGGESVQWMYLPALKRIREMGPIDSYDSFQGTDFTNSDIGFISVRGTHTLLGETNHKGTTAYSIETVPVQKEKFSKIITMVAKDSFLPLERDMYDVNGVLWKTHFFEDVTVINNIATPLAVRMVDVQTKTSTAYKVDHVCYGAVIPSEIFEPKNLANALQFDFCPLPTGE